MKVVYGLEPHEKEVSGLKRREAFNLLAFCKKAYSLNTEPQELRELHARLNSQDSASKSRKVRDSVMAEVTAPLTQALSEKMRRAAVVATFQLKIL